MAQEASEKIHLPLNLMAQWEVVLLGSYSFREFALQSNVNANKSFF